MACREPVSYGSISGTDPLDLDLSTAFDSLPLPSLDSDLFSDDLISAEGLMADLDDLDFSFDDFVLPSESNDFLGGDGSDPSSWQDPKVSDESGITSSSQGSGDRCSDGVGVLNSPSPETGSCSREFYGAGSTEDSAACTSGISGGKVLNSPSPDSAFCAGDPSGLLSYSPNSNNISSEGIADQGIKSEEVGSGCLAKRKKEKDDGNPNPRSSKARKSIPLDHASSPYAADTGTEEDDKKKARLMRNRESAQLSRQRKKHYVEELEDKVRSLHSTITELNGRINFIMAENASLRQQLSGGGVCPPIPGICPPPPMVPMPYPWVPCASYAMKPQGSQVPLVPIPRLKPQQPKSAPKIKKSESKKGEIKTKKVASVSFLGLLFFILLLGGFVPFVNVRYGGNEGTVPSGLKLSNTRLHGHPEGRVFSVTSGVNGSDHGVEVGLCSGKSGFNKGGAESIHCRKGRSKGAESEVRQNQRGSLSSPGLERSVRVGNASEPLVASLYVPRNDKLIKIDGNLIIHSVLASERAMASSHAANEVKSDKETVSSAKEAWKTSLAIAGNMAPAVAVSQGGRNAERRPHMYRNPNERQKALTSGSEHTYKENSKSTAADGSLQQWFREGLAGPILASGMCTEVFQFDVSPASTKPGAIIPATSVSNISAEHPPDTANLRKRKNRRILYPPIPLAGSALNKTEENVRRTSKNESFQGNKTVSSMVVSVLVDPREAGDVDGDGVITSKSLSRIFVVVLLDSVKYVTYSCVLPIKGSSPHLAA